jgi:hypothetical protein
LQAVADLDVEVLGRLDAVKVGVRVVERGVTVEEDLLDLMGLDVAEEAGHALVAAHEALARGVQRLLVQQFLQQLVLQALLPELVGLGLVRRPV